jgi:hypothetical protein
MIYLMDLFLGVPSIFMDTDKTAPRRRTLYGQAGRFRVKPYGMEYRSLSSFWLASPILVELIYDVSKFVLEQLEKAKILLNGMKICIGICETIIYHMVNRFSL